MQTSQLAQKVASALDKGRPDDGRETIDNRERGCGHLKPNSCYVRTDLAALGSPDGEIPPWVTLDDPIEYRENPGKGAIIPGYNVFPGNSFSLHYEANGGTTTPAGDISDHIDRLRRWGFDGDHYGDITSAHAHDILMSVGKSNWEDPESFIRECRTRGLNLKIPASTRQEPPVIEPLRTRVWVIHPHGAGEGRPGIIGYAYLTRNVFTSGSKATADDPDIPKWAEDFAKTRTDFDVVDRGEPIPADPDREQSTTLAAFEESADDLASDDREVGTIVVDDHTEVTGAEVEWGRHDLSNTARADSFERAIDDGPLTYNALKKTAANRDDVDVGPTPSKGDLINALVEEGGFVPAYGEPRPIEENAPN